MIATKRKIFLRRRARGRLVIAAESAPPSPTPGRVPRVARLMALAIVFDRMLREGKVQDQSELARLTHVTQPRMTQLMNLNLLAPDIQEALLHLPRIVRGKVPITERHLRPIAAEVDWRRQRECWPKLKSKFIG